MLILASGSPRRRAVLEHCGVPHRVRIPAGAEVLAGADPVENALRLAAAKANEIAQSCDEDEDVLAMDTLVLVAGELYGKPGNPAAAKRMITRALAEGADVVTAVATIRGHALQLATFTSHVTFGPVSKPDVQAYLDSGAWQDKAGGFGIQDPPFHAVARVDGSWSNVLGCPVAALLPWLPSGSKVEALEDEIQQHFACER